MPRKVCALFLLSILLVAAGLPRVASADENSPSIKTLLSSADDFLTDIESIILLTTAKEQKQWPVLKDYFDVFLDGVNQTKPIRIDVVLGDEHERYITNIPISNRKEFRKFRLVTLKDFGIKSRKLNSATRYKLHGDFDGYMRYKHGYAIIAELLKEIPARISHPLKDKTVVELLEKNYDLAVDGSNKEEGQPERRASFQNVRRELLATVKKGLKETDDDFAFRKKFFETQLDEVERLYVEGKHLRLGWITDGAKNTGRLEGRLVALPGTSLQSTIKQASNQPSYFANIQRSADSILSIRLSHPLDEMRKKNILALISILKTGSINSIDARDDLSNDEKKARRAVAEKVFAMLEAGAKKGIVDGFIEAHSNTSGMHTVVAGFKAVDGNSVVDILNLLPKARKAREAREGHTVETEIDSQGDVTFHKIVLSPAEHDYLKKFFGSEEMYVGSSAETVWVGAGENALAELKAAVEKVGKPNTGKAGAPFFDFYAKMKPLIKLRDTRSPKGGHVKLRKFAIDAFANDNDTFSAQMKRVDDHIEGHLEINRGILHFFGKVLADFSRDNLDEQQPANAEKNGTGETANVNKTAAVN